MPGSKSVPVDLKRSIMEDIYNNRMLLTSVRDRPGGWTLISGQWSPFYIQLRLLSSFPETLRKVAEAMSIMIREEAPHVNRLVGVSFAGVPIATAITLESGIPSCHTRKLAGVRNEQDLKRLLKEYGQHALVEGVIEDGDSLCIVDDLVTGLESKLVARAQVMSEVFRRGLTDVRCEDIAVLIDREQGAAQRSQEMGLSLHAVIGFVSEGIQSIRGLMSDQEFSVIADFMGR